MLIAPLAAAADPPRAEAPRRLFPVSPADDTVVGPRPLFVIGHDEVDLADLRSLRFRIELYRDDETDPTLTFDQRRRRHGWSPGDDGQVVYHPRKPIPDGAYEWKVAVWDGVEWIGGKPRFRLRVDSVPPGEVEALRLERGSDGDGLRLRWNPVTLDRDGGPEYVARYRVYRYEQKPLRRQQRRRQIGVTPDPWFELDAEAAATPLLFFEVTAEDEAGNEADGRGAAAGG